MHTTKIFKDANPNYTIITNPSSSSSSRQMVPGTFPFQGHPPGTPIIPFMGGTSAAASTPATTNTAAATTTTSSTTDPDSIGDTEGESAIGKKRQKSDSISKGDAEPVKKRQKKETLSASAEAKRQHRDKRLTVRKKLLKQFLREIQLHANKAGEPWYDFASLYASAMGGLVQTEDLIACYPYDFYTPSIWKKRDMMTYQNQGNVINVRGEEHGGIIDVDAEEKEEMETERQKDFPDEPIDLDKMENKARAVEVLAQHVKTLIGSHFKQHSQVASLDAILRVAARLLIEQLIRREVKEEFSKERNLSALFNQDVEEEQKNPEKTPIVTMSPSTTLSTSKSYSKSLPSLQSRIIDLKRMVTKETEKLSRIGPVSRGGIRLDIDIDDSVLYPPIDTKGDIENDYDDEYIDEISKTMGMNIFRPEFKALITLCTDNINGLSNTSNKNFTPYELCMSPVVRSQFAKFMALCTSPVNNKYSTKTPFSTQSYASNFSSNNGTGNTVIIQPAQTRYVMAANKVEIQAVYKLFERVKRVTDGLLVLQNNHNSQLGRQSGRLNAYGRNNMDDYDDDNYDHDHRRNNLSSYYSIGGGGGSDDHHHYYFGSKSKKIHADFIL